MPAILMGDLNALPKEDVITTLEKKMHRARPKMNGDSKGTFHNFVPSRMGDTIDYIFYSNGVRVEEFEVVADYDDVTDVVPSDHRPICATLKFS